MEPLLLSSSPSGGKNNVVRAHRGTCPCSWASAPSRLGRDEGAGRMRNVTRVIVLLLAWHLAAGGTAYAAILAVDGPPSSRGEAPAIIEAPPSVHDDAFFADGMRGFDERQGVVLRKKLLVDGGSVAAGTAVDSHLIFLSPFPDHPTRQVGVTWRFSGKVLGVMSDTHCSLQNLSDPLLGSPGTEYPGRSAFRGMERRLGDHYEPNGATLTVTMTVPQIGDWIRVITAAGHRAAHSGEGEDGIHGTQADSQRRRGN